MKRLAHNQQGFTLIELLLSMTLFTLTMVIATVGFIGMNRSYTRGTIRRQLSEGVQRTTDAVSQIVRSDGRALDKYKECPSADVTGVTCPPAGSWKGVACFSTARFVWGDTGMHIQKGAACNAPADDLSSGEEILSNRFRVETLKVTATAQADIFVVSGVFRTQGGDETFDNLTDPDKTKVTCKGSASGFAQTCAVEKFKTIVTARGGE